VTDNSAAIGNRPWSSYSKYQASERQIGRNDVGAAMSRDNQAIDIPTIF
jgi:hypothetical protein